MFGLIRGGESKQEEVCSLTCSLTSSSPRTKSAPLEFTMSDRNSLLSSSPVSPVSSRPAVSHHLVHLQFTVVLQTTHSSPREARIEQQLHPSPSSSSDHLWDCQSGNAFTLTNRKLSGCTHLHLISTIIQRCCRNITSWYLNWEDMCEQDCKNKRLFSCRKSTWPALFKQEVQSLPSGLKF